MRIQDQNGFTLVEIIIVIIIGSILATFISQVVSTSSTKSAMPVVHLRERIQLQDTMKKINTQYKQRLSDNTLTLANLKSYVETNFSTHIDAEHTGYFIFIDNGDNTYSASPISQTPSQDSILIVTLTNGNQRIQSIFSK